MAGLFQGDPLPAITKTTESQQTAPEFYTNYLQDIANLGQNAVQQEQWIRLGYSPEKAAVLINNRFDYTIDPVMLGITFAVIIGYFIFLLKVSDKQYREVIAEKFDHE